MPIIYEDSEVQIIETVSAAGRSVQTINKPGSLGFNREALLAKAQQALTTNAAALAIPDPTAANTTYLGQAAIPAGTLTAAQLGAALRIVRTQVDALTRQNNALVEQTRALTRQNNALIRLALSLLDNVSDT